MFWKTYSETHCFCLKPSTHCTFTERILCSIVCLMCIMLRKTSSESLCFCLKPTAQCTFTERIHRSIVCWNVYNVLKLLLKPNASAWSPALSVLSQSAYLAQLYLWMCIMFWKISETHCFCLKPTTHCTFTERILCSIVCLMCIMLQKTSSESLCFCLKPTAQCTFTERILRSIVCLNVCSVLKNFFWKPLLLLEAHHSV